MSRFLFQLAEQQINREEGQWDDDGPVGNGPHLDLPFFLVQQCEFETDEFTLPAKIAIVSGLVIAADRV